MIRSSMSGTTRTSARRMPWALSQVATCAIFLSWVRPGQDFVADHHQPRRPDAFRPSNSVRRASRGALPTSRLRSARTGLGLARLQLYGDMTEYIHVGARRPGRAAQPCDQAPRARRASRECARAGRLAAEILDALVPQVVPGVTTGEIDEIVRRHDAGSGAVPATLGYRGYTKSCCTSINHVVCHGIPGDKALKDGDIVNIDVTPILDGWHGDTSRMFFVGDVPLKARKLVDVTYECLMLGLEQARPGNRLGDIAHAIQRHAEKHRYGVVRDFCGHGLGRLFHDSPEVDPCRPPRHRARAQAGHVLHRRADDQHRPAGREAARRRLDRGHPRPLAVGPVRTFDRDHRRPAARFSRRARSGLDKPPY